MSIERRNPLPIGRYWVEVPVDAKSEGTFQGFLSAFPESVKVNVTEQDPAFTFRIFTTSKELAWPEGIGSPNIASGSVKSRADTVQRPDPVPEVLDQIDTTKLVSNVGTTLKVIGWAAGALIVLELWRTFRQTRDK